MKNYSGVTQEKYAFGMLMLAHGILLIIHLII